MSFQNRIAKLEALAARPENSNRDRSAFNDWLIRFSQSEMRNGIALDDAITAMATAGLDTRDGRQVLAWSPADPVAMALVVALRREVGRFLQAGAALPPETLAIRARYNPSLGGDAILVPIQNPAVPEKFIFARLCGMPEDLNN